jgi:NAD+ synthase
VIGTPNRLEYDQGFFVKNGDGAANVKPIAPPSTDTYSLQQGQDELHLALVMEAVQGFRHDARRPGHG